MSYDLTIRFEGLCAFVAPQSGSPKLWAVLVNAAAPDTFPGGGNHGEKHYAKLLFKYPSPATEYLMLDIDGMHVDIQAAKMHDTKFKRLDTRINTTKPDNSTQRKDYRWISRIYEAAPAFGKIFAKCIDPSLNEVPVDRVASRIAFDSGEHYTSEVLHFKPSNYVPTAEFTPPASPPHAAQAMAENVDQRFENVEGDITITLTPFGENAVPLTITLPAPTSGDALFWILNLPEDAVEHRRQGSQIERVYHPEIHHFKWFYKLSDGYNPINPPTVPLSYPIVESPPSVSGGLLLAGKPHCPVTEFTD